MMTPRYPTTLTRARLAGIINKDDPALLRGEDVESFYQNRRRQSRPRVMKSAEELATLEKYRKASPGLAAAMRNSIRGGKE